MYSVGTWCPQPGNLVQREAQDWGPGRERKKIWDETVSKYTRNINYGFVFIYKGFSAWAHQQ